MEKHKNCFYINVPITLKADLVKHVVGKNARNFATISKTTGVDYMWYNYKRRLVTIWGNKTKLQSAEEMLIQIQNEVCRKFQDNNNSASDGFVWENDIEYNFPLDDIIKRDDIQHLIGRNGYHFKEITKSSSICYMWYDDEKHCIKMWGLLDDIRVAISLVTDKLEYLFQTHPPIIERIVKKRKYN